ncbi:TonB-dependent receptor [Thalassotalea ponticola]|uniref:TonB-dependent receptor n=1 Tax=Thalassotalea ponticola TaxID=1523392 RepID=UPI0025B6020B|nr:TonB-dependent receptor [Thalassotalea ponticola]MDN3652267.1 TonB-dependent receptor [Thalassotalea ponticola]
MASNSKHVFAKSALYLALSSAFSLPTMALAQDTQAQAVAAIERIQVTGSRRSSTVQEAPMNISALDADVMLNQNISSAEDVARWVPGLTIADQGGREGASIIVRGLNTNSSERSADGGTVATYVGEIPMLVDLRLKDVERVEVLIGPQGTLYGAGTLGGAIRYILNDAELDITEGSITGDVFSLSESEDLGGEAGFVFNTPLIEDELAVRVNVNHYSAPGYVDYSVAVCEPGVSLPDPDWSDASAVEQNICGLQDVNDEQITTSRVALRWNPNDWFDATLTYFHQNQTHGGNSIVQYKSIAQENPLSELVGKYDSAYRVAEPNEKTDELLSLEMELDLGFADLVSASGWSEYEQSGQRDQTDLLFGDIWAGYADFPAFTAYTLDTGEEQSFTQELRIVSKSESAFSWIVGYYYNQLESQSDDREYTPGLTEYWFGDEPYANIEYDLEYIALNKQKLEESALFGELSYQLTDKLQVTAGARVYQYDIDSESGNWAPFWNGEISSSNEIGLSSSNAKDDGNLLKLNASYQFNDDVMTYVTVSEGYRIGGSNGITPCSDDGSIQVCALPNEMDYKPDLTTNYELGVKSSWLQNRLHLNAALFSVDWQDAQIQATTVNGQEIITANAGEANSTGVELAVRSVLSDNITAYANYSYAKAELTSDAPYLFGIKGEQGSAIQDFYDGEDGDRLPGAPEHQFSMGVDYQTDVFDDKLLNIYYGLTAQSDVITKVGLKADGEVLPGYALSNLSAKLSGDLWSVTFYVDNLFNKYAYTATRRDKSWAGMAQFESENKNLPEIGRVYGHYITKPRTVGLRFNYAFDL